jgi:hypothetical protein
MAQLPVRMIAKTTAETYAFESINFLVFSVFGSIVGNQLDSGCVPVNHTKWHVTS